MPIVFVANRISAYQFSLKNPFTDNFKIFKQELSTEQALA